MPDISTMTIVECIKWRWLIDWRALQLTWPYIVGLVIAMVIAIIIINKNRNKRA